MVHSDIHDDAVYTVGSLLQITICLTDIVRHVALSIELVSYSSRDVRTRTTCQSITATVCIGN